jgi:hypothetical protein
MSSASSPAAGFWYRGGAGASSSSLRWRRWRRAWRLARRCGGEVAPYDSAAQSEASLLLPSVLLASSNVDGALDAARRRGALVASSSP